MKRIVATTFVLALVLLASLNAAGQQSQSQSREEVLKEIEAKRTEMTALEKKLLAPSAADREANRSFLSQPDTGIMRLLPREKYDSDAYKENKRILSVRGGGSFYSFTRKTHEYGEATDINLTWNNFSVGFGGANYGMLATLGDVPLDKVNLDSDIVKTLANYHPGTAERQAREEQSRLHSGATVEGIVLKNRVLVDANMTYVLRSINFEASDALVVFRVVRMDTDGSAIIIWKLLRKYPIPQLARN